jgi:hypothetical protein
MRADRNAIKFENGEEEMAECKGCSGTGKCEACSGKGWNGNYPCKKCDKTGNCTVCKGAGKT